MEDSTSLRSIWIDQNHLEHGDRLHALNYISSEEAAVAEAERSRLLQSFEDIVPQSYSGTVFSLGALSPGCRKCTEGTWSCLFGNNKCNADCFFWPTELVEIGEPDTHNVSFLSSTVPLRIRTATSRKQRDSEQPRRFSYLMRRYLQRISSEKSPKGHCSRGMRAESATFRRTSACLPHAVLRLCQNVTAVCIHNMDKLGHVVESCAGASPPPSQIPDEGIICMDKRTIIL